MTESNPTSKSEASGHRRGAQRLPTVSLGLAVSGLTAEVLAIAAVNAGAASSTNANKPYA
jgi:hypothetical protein